MKLLLRITYLLIFTIIQLYGAAIDDPSPGLYDATSKIVLLDADNLENHLFSKPYAWFIEFYNFNCGHCKKYAPIFKEFANDVVFWNTVVKVGAVDCANVKNIDTCRKYNITRYPQLRYFPANYVEEPGKELGENMELVSTSKELSLMLSDKLTQDENNRQGLNWPNLKLQEYRSITDSKQVEFKFLVLANRNIYNDCAQVILDLSSLSNVDVVCANNNGNQMNHSEPLTLYIIHKNKTEERLATNKDRYGITNVIVEYLRKNHVERPLTHFSDSIEIKQEQIEFKYVDDRYIYYDDLEASLNYLIHHETTLIDKYSSDDKMALVQFIRVLINNFRFSDHGKEYYTSLNDYLISNDQIRGKELELKINQLDQQYKPVYKSSATWYACKGSKPQYRGFTCGLWQLFHTLTVNADRLGNDADKVLFSIHNYIKQFFTCDECRRHFLAMSKKFKIEDVNNSKKAVLWLWIAHNDVNLRIAKDETEDPKHPKVQFPPERLCSDCRDTNGQWDLEACYRFLHRYYGPKNTRVYMNGEHDIQPSSSSSKLNNGDFGLFALLYIISFFILIVVIKLFLNKKYLKKSYVWSKV